MSFYATFYTFSKRINSTKQPTGSGSQYEILLKHGCSLLEPTISLDVGQSGNPTAYNYCYIAEFSRYYFVSDWIFENRLWTARLKVDSLASHKTAIGSYSAYVIRSANQSDGKIVDSLYPAKADITETNNSASTAPSWASKPSDGGYYILGILGKSDAQNAGGVTYYGASAAQMQALSNYLLDVQNIAPTMTDISDELLKCIVNPLQYIVSAMWVPFTPTMVSGDVYVGWWKIVGNSMQPVNQDLKWRQSLSFTIPKHPKAATRGAYLNMPPFSSYSLYCAGFGAIPINNSFLIEETTLSAEIQVDLITGTGKLVIRGHGTPGAILEEHTAQIGVPIAMGQNTLNQGAVSGVINGGLGFAGSVGMGNVVGAVSSLANTIKSAAELTQSSANTIGSNGSNTLNTVWTLTGRFFDIVDEDLTSRGRPLCKLKQISQLSGYMECADADPEISCSDREMSEIVGYLNGGFYYE